MSDNKYIIDKDSLTGIADVIRNKLGNGASIDDPAAGYYPDPTKSTFLAKFKTVGGRHETGYSRYTHIAMCGMTSEDHVTAFGDTPCSYIKITSLGNPINASSSTNVTSNEFYVVPYFGNYGTRQKFNWAEGSTILIPVPNDYALTAPLAFLFMWQDTDNYKCEYDITAPEVQVEFLDENQNLMTSAIGSFSDYLSSWSAVSGSGDLTHTFEVEKIEYSPIPYSIGDMQDKIEDYWNPPAGSLNISSNGTYDVTTKVEAVVNVPNPSTGSLTINANGTYDVTEKASAVVNVPNPSTGELNINANGVYDVTDKASANVYIQPPNLQTKQSVISSNGSQIILPDSGYDALNEVDLVVQVPNPSTGSLTINANGTYDVTEKASAIVSVSPSLQTKTTTISQNGSQIITPDSNYDGLSSVNLTISVPNPSTGSLEITENGTYDVTDKASAIVNVPSSGGLPPFTVPTFKVYTGRSGGNAIDLSSYFSTQEEMLEHLVDVELGSSGNPYNAPTGSYDGSNTSRYPICKDKYGRWISMKKLGITLPSSLSYGYGSPADKWSITNAHNNDLTFCFGTASPFNLGLSWIAIVDRYILLGYSNYIDYLTTWYSVIVEA